MVAPGNMADLMGQYAGQFCLVIHLRQQTTGHIDIAPRGCKGVRLKLVNYGKAEGIRGRSQRRHQSRSHALQVGIQFRIGVKANLISHLN